jgi:hypothetical protein
MLRGHVLAREWQNAAHHGWQLHTDALRVPHALQGQVPGWQQNQHPGSPSSLSRVTTAEEQGQPGGRSAQLTVRQPA